MKYIEKTFYDYPLSGLGLNPFLSKILQTYDLNEENMKDLFELPKLLNPYEAKGMLECGKILKRIKENREKILICGDYDADGICATAILAIAFTYIGIDFGYYIPDRIKEGYGLNCDTVRKALGKGYRNFITVDNGVKAYDAMKLIKEAGAVLILSDHHEYESEKIWCDCFLHPQTMGDAFSTLSGAGVAAMIGRMLYPQSKEIVILAGIASIADCMPMWKQTRSLTRLAIQYLNQGMMPAIQKLKNRKFDPVDETLIGFQIAPKINGTGRMSDIANANNTVRYLLSSQEKLLDSVSKQIEEVNQIRKQLSKAMCEKASQYFNEEERFPLIVDQSFHEGIVGLVAGQLSSQYQRPVMVMSEKAGICKGSARASGGLDLVDFFADFPYFSLFGGHKAAIGCSFEKMYERPLREYITHRMLHQKLQEPQLSVIGVKEEELDIINVESLDILRPFGTGFEEPIFKVLVQIEKIVSLQGGQHVKVTSIRGIDYMFFNQLHDLNYHVNDWVVMVGKVSINRFLNSKKVQMNVLDSQLFNATF